MEEIETFKYDMYGILIVFVGRFSWGGGVGGQEAAEPRCLSKAEVLDRVFFPPAGFQ